MNILVTAIGSMSAECVITALKKRGHRVIGCDIYPGEWHYETTLCDNFYQAPFANSVEYIQFLLDIVEKHKIEYLFPLTDVEIDALTDKRNCFTKRGCTICFSSEKTISIVRDKYKLYSFFKEDKVVPSIKTWLTNKNPNSEEFINYPYIAKPCGGRSSEGLIKIDSQDQLQSVLNKEDYLIQEFVKGSIFTVDYVRQSSTGKNIIIPRQELIRSANGAGLTIKLVKKDDLKELVQHIGRKLDINGCVNMEFIYDDNCYYLIDVNPRFSAGVGFSQLTGNDFVNGHLACFLSKERTFETCPYEENIIVKRDIETVIG